MLSAKVTSAQSLAELHGALHRGCSVIELEGEAWGPEERRQIRAWLERQPALILGPGPAVFESGDETARAAVIGDDQVLVEALGAAVERWEGQEALRIAIGTAPAVEVALLEALQVALKEEVQQLWLAVSSHQRLRALIEALALRDPGLSVFVYWPQADQNWQRLFQAQGLRLVEDLLAAQPVEGAHKTSQMDFASAMAAAEADCYAV